MFGRSAERLDEKISLLAAGRSRSLLNAFLSGVLIASHQLHNGFKMS